MAPEFWLGRKIRARSMAMTLQLPDALDLLTISVEAGLGFDAALAKVVEKMEGPLVDEFRQALAEVRMGRTRREALRDVATRADAQPVSNFIGAIVQAEQLGVPIAKVLQIQSNQLRIERRQRAEEAAAKAPVKMLFPMVGCIFPTIFIVILGPAVVTVMGGGLGRLTDAAAGSTGHPPGRRRPDPSLGPLAARGARRLRRRAPPPPGPAALKQLEGSWPALLVVDLMMPGMDGFELCRRVKQLADLPIIVLSAVDASEAKVSALELYAEDYVTKPFDPDELVARIQRVLRRAPIGSPQISLDGGDVEVDLATRPPSRRPPATHQLTPDRGPAAPGPGRLGRPGHPDRGAPRPRLDRCGRRRSRPISGSPCAACGASSRRTRTGPATSSPSAASATD